MASSSYSDITESSRSRSSLTIEDSDLYSSLGDIGYQEETSSGGFLGSIKDAFTDLGDVVWNDRREPVPIYNFFVRGEMGLLDAPCKSVRAFTREYDYEEIQEGGRNDYVIMKRKPISHRYTLQIERYVGMDLVDPFALGTEFVAPLLIGVKRILPLTSGFADTLENTELIRLYTFTGCIVTGKEYGELDAEKSGLLTETVTIAYREMICLTTPNADNVVEHWKVSDYADTSKDSLKRAKSETLLKSWEEVEPEVSKWNVGFDADGITNLNDPDKRSAQRPVGDTSEPEVKKWNVGLDVDKKTNLNVDENRRAHRNDDLDKTDATGKKWNVGYDADGKTNLNVPTNRSAKRNDAMDEAKASGKKWGIRPDERDAANKSAQIPAGDDKKGKPKEWDIKHGDKNKSANTPPGDSKKAKKRGWDITKKDKNKSAATPSGDEVGSEGTSWNIKEKDKNKSAIPPTDDDKAAKGKSYDYKTRKEKSARVPEGDAVEAKGRSYDYKTREEKSARVPEIDGTEAKGSEYNYKERAEKRAAVPANDSDKAEPKSWSIKTPKVNQHAVIMKDAASIADFLKKNSV